MKGVVFAGDRTVEFREFPDPTPGPGEVVLEIKASGMCGSDLKMYRAAPGEAARALGIGETGAVIAGHEPCGVVAAVGAGVSERQARVGQRVMVHHYRGCGVCPHCSTGWMQLCVDGVAEVYGATGHGAHAPYMKCPARTLVNLPDQLSFATGAAIACGTGTAWGALQRLDLKGDQTIAIFGQGPVGLSATQLASAMGARVIALDISDERLGRAKSFGADVVINPAQVPDVVAAIRDVTHGLGAHATLDASSSSAARRQSVQAVRTWGKACFVGEGGNVTLDVSPDLLRRQVTIIGSWTFSTVGQAECATYVADRGIDVDALFTDRWKLEQAEEAYRLFDQQTGGKGVFLS
ncbi:threonine dehydrogenase-like Zn-dependent dehydrogenase [Stella humosa]|uniref:Threonine dehydrogenase-like Zn-dependent dehydrogenase n=1 Tax=Stella humosa TaxID=94 RepID=A0A3N1MB69_9PROT|nr:zinc-binding dehydrogenase [Stella humosa]ROQ00983.1 threonine dehydrogenase-like Zn-dependent dehydrogenase [Stella humosa]BBK31350.1 oxidoreductase [Stella humosa]